MNNNPLVTIIAPFYNCEDHIHKKCIDSILNQTYSNTEVIFVDDGSTDNTSKMLDDYSKTDSRIKVFHTENRGTSSARQLALDNSTGELITFIDTDDWVDSDYIENMYQHMLESKCDIVQCGRYITSDSEEFIFQASTEILDGKEMIVSFMSPKVGISGTPWAKLYRKKILDSISFRPNMIIWDDYIFLRDVLFNNPGIRVEVYKDAKYHWYQRIGSGTHSATNYKKISSYEEIQKDVPADVFKVKEFKDWHYTFLEERCLDNILGITKSMVCTDKYLFFCKELRKMFFHLFFNEHLIIKRKIAMEFAAILPRMFFFARTKKFRLIFDRG